MGSLETSRQRLVFGFSASVKGLLGMHHYQNILYISHGATDEVAGLTQALSLARNNQAPLKILVVFAPFPKEFPEFHEAYENFLRSQAEQAVASVKQTLNMAPDAVAITIDLVRDETPALRIIEHALFHQHDLLIKEAETWSKSGRAKAIDLDLLRKCPIPVWLCKPISRSRQEIKVAVAVDPEFANDPSEKLVLRLLELAQNLAQTCSGTLEIVSCWDYVFEGYLRGSIWVTASDAVISQTVLEEQSTHRAQLDQVIQRSGIPGPYNVHHLRGHPTDMIPDFIQAQGVDILVMGTVGRTGLPGFLIGNTAENIVQQVDCSLLALKPEGFQSPIQSLLN